ncbi:MAG: AI-2E family transporter, partial [Candidatus Levyibacteriota bacterium]
MAIRLRTVFFFSLTVIAIWFLFVERAILTPFIVGAIFAYIFNPIVNFFSEKIKIPRSVSVLFIYVCIVGIVVGATFLLTQRLLDESSEIRNFSVNFLHTANAQVSTIPSWLKPTAIDFIKSLEKSRIFSLSLLPLFPKAISRIISFIIFIFSGYYFLKEGNKMLEGFFLLVPKEYRIDVEILFRKINGVLGGYLRGQVFLIFLMAGFSSLALSILGVRFSILLGVFSGFAEIVPVIGPILAGSLAASIVFFTGTINFSLSPWEGAIVVAVIYFVLRQFEDYFIIPHV